MSLLGVLVLLLIAAVCGAVGRALAGGGGGLLTAIGLGLIGAVVGYALANALDLPTLFVLEIEGKTFPVVWSIAGAALFSALLGLLTRRPRVA